MRYRMAALFLGVLTFGVGCTTESPAPVATSTPPVVDAEELPPAKLAALLKADSLISEGIDDKEKGQKLKSEGKEQEGNDLLKQGEEKVLKGQIDKEEAMKLTN